MATGKRVEKLAQADVYIILVKLFGNAVNLQQIAAARNPSGEIHYHIYRDVVSSVISSSILWRDGEAVVRAFCRGVLESMA